MRCPDPSCNPYLALAVMLRAGLDGIAQKRDPGPQTVEQQLERLEEIVEQLAGDGIELDGALKLFEEGVARLRAVTERLSQAESRVKLLVEDGDGDFSLEDLDA